MRPIISRIVSSNLKMQPDVLLMKMVFAKWHLVTGLHEFCMSSCFFCLKVSVENVMNVLRENYWNEHVLWAFWKNGL